MEVQYSSILPYLIESNIKGDKIYCHFKIEHKTFEASAIIKNNKLGAELVSHMVQKAGVGKIRSMLQLFLKKNTDFSDIKETAKVPLNYTQEDKKIAIEAAFESIQDELIYDKKLSKWRLVTHLSEFEIRVKRQPLEEDYDRDIMYRMLVEMAKADGRIGENERLFFDNFIDNKAGKLGKLIRAVNLKETDCYPLKEQNRPIIYLIVCAVAVTDNTLNTLEKAKLDCFATILGISSSTKKELLEIAQDYSLQLFIISKDNYVESADLQEFARNIGMQTSHVKKTLERLR